MSDRIDDVSTRPTAASGPTPTDPDQPERAGRRLNRPDLVVTAVLVLGVVLLTGFRLYLSLHRTGPVVIADEIGYLVNARVLAGGEDGLMVRASVYAGGYAVALIPAYLVADGPESAYRLVLGTNAVLGAMLLPLLYLVLRRGLEVARMPAMLCALAGALYPPVVGFSQLALSENLLAPLLVGWLLCLIELFRARRTEWASITAVAGGLATGWLYATHARMLPVIAIELAALVLLAGRRHIRWLVALLGVVATAISCLGAYLLNAYLYDASWPGKALDQQDRALANLLSGEGLSQRWSFVAGESAYLLLASFGLAGVGVVALLVIGWGGGTGAATTARDRLRAAWRSGTGAGLEAGQVRVAVAWTTLLVLGGLLVVTGVGSGDFTRPDHSIYGRYVEIITPLLLAVGLAALTSWLWTGAPAWALWSAGAALTGLTTIVTIDGAGDAFDATNIAWANVSGLWVTGGSERIDPARAAAVGILVLGVIAVLARGRLWAVAALGTSVLLVWCSVRFDVEFYEPRQGRYYPSPTTVDDFLPIAEADHLAYDTSVTSEAEFVYQHYLDQTTIELFDSRTEAPPPDADIVFSTDTWAGGEDPGVDAVWRDPVFGITAWRVG